MASETEIVLSDAAKDEIQSQLKRLDEQISVLDDEAKLLKVRRKQLVQNRNALAVMVSDDGALQGVDVACGRQAELKNFVVERIKTAGQITVEDLVDAVVDAGFEFGDRSAKHIIVATLNGYMRQHLDCGLIRDGEIYVYKPAQ